MARPAGGLWEAGYRVLMKRNSVYVAFILGGALIGERVVDYGLNSLWEKNNAGKLWKHLEPKIAASQE